MFTSVCAVATWITSIVIMYYLLNIGIVIPVLVATILFYVFVYVIRADQPVIYTQLHSHPHKYLTPFLTSSLSFRPPILLWNRYFETFIPDFIKVPLPFETTHEIINVKAQNPNLHFDGQCSITWSPHTIQHQLFPELSPILIIVPGLTGDVNAKYCRRMMIDAHRNGWQSVIFNPRY